MQRVTGEAARGPWTKQNEGHGAARGERDGWSKGYRSVYTLKAESFQERWPRDWIIFTLIKVQISALDLASGPEPVFRPGTHWLKGRWICRRKYLLCQSRHTCEWLPRSFPRRIHSVYTGSCVHTHEGRECPDMLRTTGHKIWDDS